VSLYISVVLTENYYVTGKSKEIIGRLQLKCDGTR
jgi:hypothetical protein